MDTPWSKVLVVDDDPSMLRLIDVLLFSLARYRPWARERMVYRALAVISDDRPATRPPR